MYLDQRPALNPFLTGKLSVDCELMLFLQRLDPLSIDKKHWHFFFDLLFKIQYAHLQQLLTTSIRY